MKQAPKEAKDMMTEKQLMQAKINAYRVVNIMDRAYSSYEDTHKNSLLRECNKGFKITDAEWKRINVK